MKDLKDFIREQQEISNATNIIKEGDEVKDEKSFRKYAENKFKEVYRDELDEDKMKETIDGILKDNKEDVEGGDWGKLVGILNKSFGK